MKIVLIIVFFASLLFFYSCKNDDSKIYFRVQNNLGENISRCYLGHRVLKGSNSYMSKSYKVRWTDLTDGEITSYKKVKGKFWGYSNCSLEFRGDNKKYPHQTSMRDMDAAIAALGLELIDDSVIHPYTKNVVNDKRLPDGKYTLVIEGFNPKFAQTILVRIVKDK